MKAMVLAITLFGGSCLAMLAVGCGGGEEEGTPTASAVASPVATEAASPTLAAPSPTLPAESRAELEALLKAAALHVADLPSGFTFKEEEFATNEEAASGDPIDPQQRLSDFGKWGRLLGYKVSYGKLAGLGALADGTVSITVQIAIYRDVQGAQAFIAASRERIENPELAAKVASSFEDGDFRNATISRMSFAPIGDATVARELTAEPTSGMVSRAVVQDVIISEGRVLGIATTFAMNSPSPSEELEGLVRKLHERIQAALKNPPKPATATPAPTTPATPKATPTPAAGLSRGNALPLGQTAVVPPGWEVTVLGVDEDAWPEVQAENTFNDPPERGYRMVLITA
jgi:hypothetical protein